MCKFCKNPTHVIQPGDDLGLLMLEALVGLERRFLDEYTAATGMPQGDIVPFTFTSPGANVVKQVAPTSYPGVLRFLTITSIGTAAMVTVTYTHPDKQNQTGYILQTGLASGQPFISSAGFRVRIPAGAIIQVATNQAGTTNLCGCYHIEPLELTEGEYFHYRKTTF